MSFITKLAKLKTNEEKRHSAISAAAAIVQMDPHARADLITYMKAFNAAERAGDEGELEYLVKAILEVLEFDTVDDGVDLNGWENEIASSPQGKKAEEALRKKSEAFFRSYESAKARSRLKTIRAVAKAAGLSPTTVQAIEKQRVKPQFKTILSLARAFGVDPRALCAAPRG